MKYNESKIKGHRKYTLLLCLLSLYFYTALILGQEKNTSLTLVPKSVEAYEGYTNFNQGYTLRIDERFDGSELNLDLWTWGDGTFQENICSFDKTAIELHNGLMNLTITPTPMPEHLSYTASDKNGPTKVGHRDYRCGELQSKGEFRYGILEVRMKTPRISSEKTNSGFVASMFTYHQSYPHVWQEIDYEVQGQYDDRFTSNLIFGKNCTNWLCTRAWGSWEGYTNTQGTRTPEKNAILKMPSDYSHSSNFHVIKIVWHPQYIRWYLDGIMYRELSNDSITSMPATDNFIGTKNKETHIPNTFAKIMFNFWLTNNGKDFGGINTSNQYPMKAQYDWFRYYSLDGYDQPYSRRPQPPFDYGYLNRK